MKHHVLRRSVALLTLGTLVAAGCGSDDDAASPTSASPTSASPTSASPTSAPPDSDPVASSATGGAVDLADVCPANVVIQTDWFPEAEHGALYQLLGADYDVDVDNKVVSGPLMAGGEDTGVTVEIRTGGPAIGEQTVAATVFADDSITLAYANTEAQVLQNAETPLVSVIAPLELNPQIIYWDPAAYPDVKTLADLGTENVTINIFGGGVFADVFVAQEIWSEDQVDPSYDGSPARFIAEDGKIAQQGFASAEPYSYETVFPEWGKPLAFQTLHDAGFEVYSQTVAARAGDLEELGPCLEKLVPVIQQATVDYVTDPATANAIIIDAVEQYDTFWTYDQGLADYSVTTQKELGLVGNGADGTLGNMDGDRIQKVIDQMRDAGLDVPTDLTADMLFTNDFIDPSIGL